MPVYKYCWRVTDIHDFRDDTVQIGDEHGLQSQFQQAIGQILCHVHWFPAQNYEERGHEYDWPTERRNQATALHQRFCYKYTKSNRGTVYNWWIALHGYARGAWGGTNKDTSTAAVMTSQTTLNLEWLRERWAAGKLRPKSLIIAPMP
ncbi:hypothetical protein N7501_003151 [Penicillium viridicatum]|nr:hypothetical protein N7501_003151 [Penicillium viridicatum]